MARPFKSELVIKEMNYLSGLHGFHIGFDQGSFRLTPLVDIIRSVIPEFALGYHEGIGVPLTEMVDKLREAADIVYNTDKYQKRGEFGELVLHLLLREFFNTIPLISKIYFKDSANTVVHGFDGIQVFDDGTSAKLWIGESKFYATGDSGVKALAKDVHDHINAEFIRQEFELISRKIPASIPNREHWINLMDKHQKLDVIFTSICIALVCTYTSDTLNNHTSESDQYFEDLKNECEELKKELDSRITEFKDLEIFLMLVPIPDKNVLNDKLDSRLKAMQSI